MPAKPRLRRLLLLWLPLLLVVVLVAFVVSFAVSAVRVRSHLQDAQQAVTTLQSDLLDRSATKTRIHTDLARLQASADAAARQTDSPLWRLPAVLPFAGDPVRQVAGVAGAVSDLADDVLPPITAQRGLLMHSLMRPDGSIDLDALAKARGPVARASAASQRILHDLNALPDSGIGPLDHAATQLTDRVQALDGHLGTADEALRLLPPMLGQDGPRRYFVAFQNDTEARGLGGLPGAYAILQADHGKLSFTRFGSDTDFSGVGPVSIADFGPDYQRLYRGAAPQRLFGNSNVSPHFPYAAQLWMRYWHAKTGEHLDGALTMDPSGLAKLLEVSGPAKLVDGTTVSADNVVALTQRIAYTRFPDVEQRRAFNLVVAKAVAAQVLGKGPDQPMALASALGADVADRRLLVWSAHDKEQQRLAELPVGGTLSDTRHLFAGVVINNAAGSKLDYYLKRDVRYQAPPCTSGSRTAKVTITLTNTAPKSGLPDYVAARVARPPAPGFPRGTERLLVGYYATKGAHFTGAELDGKQALLTADVERGRPVFTATVEVPPQQSRTLTLRILEPAGATGPVHTLVQPLVIPQTTRMEAPTCERGSR